MDEREIPEMLIGTIAGLWRYPVKSLAAQPLVSVMIEPDGIAGDRRTALLVTSADHPRSGKPFRGKEHGLLHTVATPRAARALGAEAGVELQAVSAGRYFDAQPISLIWDSWLHDVEMLVGYALDPLRYRPNLFAQAASGFSLREHALIGATIDIGAAALRVVAPIHRCVTTTYDVATGHSDPAVLREVAQRRANTLGVYCTVERSGAVARGDAIATS
jgi:uncharacterized protein YcbX